MDAATLAEALADEHPQLRTEFDALAAHRDHLAPGPAVVLEDSADIPLIDRLPAAEGFQLRARIRAGDGDLVLANPRPPRGFEEYYADRLGLGRVRWLHPGAGLELSASTLRSDACMRELVERARAGGLHVKPYLASEAVWDLVTALSRAAGAPLPVAGPPPHLCALANDKTWFLPVAARLLGEDSVPPFRVARSERELSQALTDLPARHVAIRVPTSTAGLGLHMVDTSPPPLVTPPTAPLTPDDLPALVIGWLEPVLASPSVHLWIPPLHHGDPTCDGVILQTFSDPLGTRFSGGVTASLPHPVDARLRSHSLALARLLQLLGYVGRCSLDFILVGDHLEDAAMLCVDCNARWGGASVVVSLVRAVHGRAHRPFAFGFLYDDRLKDADLGELISRLGVGPDDLIVYNAGCMEGAGRLDVAVLADSPQQAMGRLRNDIPTLLDKALQ
ncbi:hypothetical protein ABT294_36550 [Nonomuraea sp. NPDC000554]|uniref:preATP grasp domain-containing protein n=1 Tax=Nonomuraea sp. NPDC000554 TaxID=3154259 RepID=UPI003332D292